MGELMKKKMMDEGKSFFEVWMYEVSDQIQSLAGSYGDRYMLEQALAVMNTETNIKAKVVIERAIFLYAVFTVKENQNWFMVNGCVSNEAAQELGTVLEQAVKAFVPHLNTAVEALGVFTYKHLIGPIGRDYVAFNAQTENENYSAAGEIFDFRTTGNARL